MSSATQQGVYARLVVEEEGTQGICLEGGCLEHGNKNQQNAHLGCSGRRKISFTILSLSWDEAVIKVPVRVYLCLNLSQA